MQLLERSERNTVGTNANTWLAILLLAENKRADTNTVVH
jgi:hypothetical protein